MAVIILAVHDANYADAICVWILNDLTKKKEKENQI